MKNSQASKATTKPKYSQAQISEVLKCLDDAGFRANVRKYLFMEVKLEYLGYWLTRKGIQPQPKKVEAVQRILAP